jgi:hypothetical protein
MTNFIIHNRELYGIFPHLYLSVRRSLSIQAKFIFTPGGDKEILIAKENLPWKLRLTINCRLSSKRKSLKMNETTSDDDRNGFISIYIHIITRITQIPFLLIVIDSERL